MSSLAYVANNACVPWVTPTLLPLGSGQLKLEGARHPCLEAQDTIRFIANDVQMTVQDSRFHIITGPNMGGKSTFIRQVDMPLFYLTQAKVAVISLMAQNRKSGSMRLGGHFNV